MVLNNSNIKRLKKIGKAPLFAKQLTEKIFSIKKKVTYGSHPYKCFKVLDLMRCCAGEIVVKRGPNNKKIHYTLTFNNIIKDNDEEELMCEF